MKTISVVLSQTFDSNPLVKYHKTRQIALKIHWVVNLLSIIDHFQNSCPQTPADKCFLVCVDKYKF